MTSRVYRAMCLAAERIGANNYRTGLAAHLAAGRKARTYRYVPTQAHRDIVATMVTDATDDEAMALLHTHDAMAERFPSAE